MIGDPKAHQPCANADLYIINEELNALPWEPTAAQPGVREVSEGKMTTRAAQPTAQHTPGWDKALRLRNLEEEVKYANLALGGNPAVHLCDRISHLRESNRELLEALEALILLRSSTATSELWVAVWDRVEAAIAHAKGTQL
jgi:hypothetical protein